MTANRDHVPCDPAPPLLLYSMSAFWPLLEPVLRALNPRKICEVGTEKGGLTERLLAFCETSGSQYIGVDPTLSPDFLAAKQKKGTVFLKDRSLDVLNEIVGCDVYFIDGDHNYYTVYRELTVILESDPAPLIFLHDVSWPWARRDLYYNPDSIPDQHRHPCTDQKGPHIRGAALREDGFVGVKSDENFYAAEAFGGVKNGVLTAAEAAVGEAGVPGWKLSLIPAVFGLGIIWQAEALPGAVNRQLESLDRAAEVLNPILSILEHNRVELFLQYLQCDEMMRQNRGVLEDLTRRNKKLRDDNTTVGERNKKLREHNKGLQKHNKGLETHNKGLQEHIKGLQTHNSGLQAHNEELSRHYRSLADHAKALAGQYEDLAAYCATLKESKSTDAQA